MLDYLCFSYSRRLTRATDPVGGDIFEGVGADYAPTVGHRLRNTGSDNVHKSNDTADKTRQPVDGSNATATSGTRTKPYFDVSGDAEASNTLNATKDFMQELSQRFVGKDDDKAQEKVGLLLSSMFQSVLLALFLLTESLVRLFHIHSGISLCCYSLLPAL